ncbi:MAG: alpha/beta hydrolase [Deltaproteobacteria bacterium]|nr:alpha/beta hydrolase [Deltaproteobacteria bacterium]
MKTREIKINGLNLNVNFWGNSKKPKLFLFHGWMDMGASFEFVCRDLQKDFYCIAPDLRGFGRSEHVKNPLGYFFYEYIADANEIFNKLAPGEAVKALGHSMGGNIISLYAGAFPERVSHFVNIEGFGIQDMPPSMGPDRMRQWIESPLGKGFKVYKKIPELADRLIQSNPHLPLDRALFLAKHLGKKVKGGFVIAADPKHKMKNPYLFQLENIYAFWEKIQAKCLLISAEQTDMGEWMGGKEDLQREITERYRHFPNGSQTVVMKECGHMIHHEKPGELARLVREFLR